MLSDTHTHAYPEPSFLISSHLFFLRLIRGRSSSARTPSQQHLTISCRINENADEISADLQPIVCLVLSWPGGREGFIYAIIERLQR